MRILVSGASGFIGRALLARLAELGHEAVPLRRPAGGDLAAAAEGDWPADVGALVHLAALNPERGEGASRDDAALMAANANGAAALARRTACERVPRFVFASTALVHPLSPRPVSIGDPTAPQNEYAASKLAGERSLAEALAGTGTALAVLRLPPVYGPGGRGGVAALARLAALPVPLPLGGGERRSLLSLANAADAFALAAAAPDPLAGTFFAADDAPLTTGEIVVALRRGLGRAPLILPAPVGLARALARPLGRAALVDRLFAGLVLDDAPFRARAGWHPRERTPEALAALASARSRA